MPFRFSSLASSLTRRTSGGGFLPVIDGLRFVAIGWVFLFHSAGWVAARLHGVEGQLWAVPASKIGPASWIASVAGVGFFGVQLFFAISGFVLALPFCRARLDPEGGKPAPGLGAYFLRRITRLEPPYVCNILFCAAWTIASESGRVSEVVASAGASLVYMHSALMPNTAMLNSVAWSLEIEARFYILAPLLACVFLVRNATLRRGLILASIVICCLLQDVFKAHLCFGHSIVNQGQYFLVGFLLADVYACSWSRLPGSRAWDMIGLLAWTGLIAFVIHSVRDMPKTHGSTVHLLNCAAIFLAYAGALRGTFLSRAFSFPPVYVIGGMCYTIYLWHYFGIGALGKVLGARLSTGWLSIDILVYAAAFAALSAPFMIMMFVFVERPCMDKDWPSKAWQRIRPARWGRRFSESA
jgi:peptidoglycan/LPS O-acetylase OafA/YrhL